MRSPLRKKCDAAAISGMHQINLNAVEATDGFRRQYAVRRSINSDASIDQQGHALTARKGLLRIVGGHEYAIALRRQAFQPGQQPQLMAEIEAGERLIHHQQTRVLGQGTGNQGQLSFAAKR